MSWPTATPTAFRPATPSAETAKTLILVGLVLESIWALVFVFVGLIGLVFLWGFFFLAAGVVGLLILYLVYTYTYVRIQAGDYEGAQTPTLVWTILLLITLSIISGILFLIAYLKLGDAIRESRPPSYPYAGMPYAPTGAAAPAPLTQGPAVTVGTPGGAPASYPPGYACPRCGSPLTFVPQYGRWYCGREQSYV